MRVNTPSISFFRKKIFGIAVILVISSLVSPVNVIASVGAGEEHIIPLEEIVSGRPPPDGIPSIDSPKFAAVNDADQFLADSDKIVGINISGDIRAYPLQILVWHEIVNDNVGGVPVAITYCPLCFYQSSFQ
jgi:hypothetical protein